MARITTRDASARSAVAHPAEVATTERRLQERQAFDDIMSREWSWAQPSERPLPLLMVRFAIPASASLHGADTAGAIEQAILENIHRLGDVAARYASDGASIEYSVLLPATDRQGAVVVARNIQATLQGNALLGLACTAGPHYATLGALIEVARSELAHASVCPPPHTLVHHLAA